MDHTAEKRFVVQLTKRDFDDLENAFGAVEKAAHAGMLSAFGRTVLRVLNAVMSGQEVTSNNETGATEMKKYSLKDLPADDVIWLRLKNVAVRLTDARNAVQAFSNPHIDSGLRDVEIDPGLIDRISLVLGDVCTDLSWVREEAARRTQENGPGTDTADTIKAALIWLKDHAGRKTALDFLRRHGRSWEIADLKRWNYPALRAAIEGWADAKGFTVGEYAAGNMTDSNETL